MTNYYLAGVIFCLLLSMLSLSRIRGAAPRQRFWPAGMTLVWVILAGWFLGNWLGRF